MLSWYTLMSYTADLAAEILQRPSVLKGISFPSIRKWLIEGENEFLASLDLRHADAIELWSTNNPTNRLFASFPNQLTTLTLDLVIFTLDALPGGRRHSLPCLTSLTLSNIVFLGPIRRYFHCPKLNYLEYNVAVSDLREGTAVEVTKNPYQAPMQETFDQTFFQESSALGYIRLRGTRLNDASVPILTSCPVLYSLKLEECRMETFIHPFLKKLQDSKYLPNLRTLSIDDSWPPRPFLPYRRFVAQCNSIRPGMDVFGNGQKISPDAFSDTDQSLSSLDSDSDEDSD
jgi:hypothetical protein